MQSDGLNGLFTMILNGPDLMEYYGALHTLYPSRNDFATALDTNPNIAYTRDPTTADFIMDPSNGGLQFVIPTVDSGAATGATYVASYRYYDGISVQTEENAQDELLLPTRIIGDIVNQADGVQQMAFDLQATYDEDHRPSNISIDFYFNPYILNIDITVTHMRDGNTKIDAELQIFGPASCDFNIQLSMINEGDSFADGGDHPTLSLAMTAAVNNGLIVRNVTDSQARDAAILAYEKTSGNIDPVAAASGNAYFDADIYVNDIHIADINA